MHFSPSLASLLSILPILITAHGGIPGAPKLFGRQFLAGLSSRSALTSKSEPQRVIPREPQRVAGRQSTTACGPEVGACAAGLCCSASGYCGTGKEFCAAPDCQFNYGPACDANASPPGASTESVSRAHLGSVLYGDIGVYDCVVSLKLIYFGLTEVLSVI
jgi:hypothetical protein